MRIHRTSFWRLLPIAVLALTGMHGVAMAETCSGFKWPVDTEIGLIAAHEAEAVTTGGTIASIPTKAIELRLEPSPTVKFPITPGIKKQAIPQNSFSGWLTIAGVQKPGLYQITLPNHAWIDVVQNDELVQSTAFSGDPNCKTVRKSVRFELGVGSATVQIGGASENSIKLTIREADGK
ncbi:hypothetical protein HYPDE_28178 [Hyphomicrobium denitrificans 1NES1]|uniref:Uncharacterized protein n=1 Tax=Hyphomicrobium denitrificans 1NES1 TaxID=670307 RepID=N0BB16_9HYPH|nr:hypothetical protein [Hyphomicrobium denitrificans]AGK57315.1 hypothetical protein HYPDE_28178 [Hyphomicrobium denitrificans 1NES1]